LQVSPVPNRPDRSVFAAVSQLRRDRASDGSARTGGIENRLHWVLDVSFGEDGSTLRKDNAPQNLSLLKKIVLNLIGLDSTGMTKASLRPRRKGDAWDDDVRMKIAGLTPL
jgi:hypothetical protein